MRKTIYALGVAALALTAVSCADDDETVYSTDCYISSFTLGNVKQQLHTTSSTGEDSVYYATFSGSAFPMEINQLDQTISNSDSLPVNSVKTAILATINATGSVVYKPENLGDDAWTEWSSSDSIDFSSPLVFRVFSVDGSYSRDYTVKLNVHRVDGDEFSWSKCVADGAWAGARQIKMFMWQEQAYMLTKQADGLHLYTAPIAHPRQWIENALICPDDADVQSVVVMADKLIMSTTDGEILLSADAQTWNEASANVSALQVLTANSQRAFALSNGEFYSSVNGEQWEKEIMEDKAAYVPTTNISAVSYAPKEGQNRIVLAGTRADYAADTTAHVWSRFETLATANPMWSYFTQTIDNHYNLPQIEQLQLLRYDEVLLALGVNKTDAETGELCMYVSQDQGITWKQLSNYTLPFTEMGTSQTFSAAVDSEKQLWLTIDGQMWRGCMGSVLFE